MLTLRVSRLALDPKLQSTSPKMRLTMTNKTLTLPLTPPGILLIAAVTALAGRCIGTIGDGCGLEGAFAFRPRPAMPPSSTAMSDRNAPWRRKEPGQGPFLPRSRRRRAPVVAPLGSSDLTKTDEDRVSSQAEAPGGTADRLGHDAAGRGGGGGGFSRRRRSVPLDASTYEAALLATWEEEESYMRGFDWEMEKLRRYFAGLRLTEDGTWVRQPSFFDFLVSRSRKASRAADVAHSDPAAASVAPRPVNVIDVVTLFAVNTLANVGFGPQLGMAAVPDAVIQKYEGSFFSFIKGALGGDLQTLAGGPLFLLLAKYYSEYGPIFNLSFGPKSFLIVSDPVMAKHLLRSSPDSYCKGVLSEILEPIMGQGLIPADPATWRVRRRAIVPGFHKRWLNRMVTLFADCGENLVDKLAVHAPSKAGGLGTVVDMEERFCSVTLDIIGKAVFNYDFGSVTKESPVVKAVYRILREAEHRSSSFIPYWNLPYADRWIEGQVEFRRDMTMMDDILADLINRAVTTRKEATVEELEERDNDDDPSLLRFLVDMRGEDLSSKVLRDDLMTMLIAGHETTAAMLTWTVFELATGDPGMLRDVRAEVDRVLEGKSRPEYDDLLAMPRLRYALIEALRLYPEPPILIRRARLEDTLPAGGSGLDTGIKVLRGTDIFISTWNLHRSPELWENPEKFDPTRWERGFSNKGIQDWEGYNPDKHTGLYPNEIASDFAFLPFGGGQRKCVGDQFAMMEAAVTLSMLLKNYEFSLAIPAEEVGMKTGATIHTMNGLQMYVQKRPTDAPPAEPSGWWEQQHLSRGLNLNGKPYTTEEEAAWETISRDANGQRLEASRSHDDASAATVSEGLVDGSRTEGP